MEDLNLDDRGPAKHFHGRVDERRMFREVLDRATRKGVGTTVVFQGSQGSGKTALLAELATDAGEAGFRVARIQPLALKDPLKMRAALQRSAKRNWIWSLQLTVLFLPVKAQAHFGGRTIAQLLHKAAKQKGIVLILDEAQHLSMHTDSAVIRETLDAIHNGLLEVPVVLLCGGLNDTSATLRKLGISRFQMGHVVQLRALDERDSLGVIQDWLVHEGGADPADIGDLASRIQDKAHGWPQHLIGYLDPASRALKESGGPLNREQVKLVIQQGHRTRAAYYQMRLDSIPSVYRSELTTVVRRLDEGRMRSVQGVDQWLKPRLTLEQRKGFIDAAIHSGILVPEKAEFYSLPIPSMTRWMLTPRSAPAPNA